MYIMLWLTNLVLLSRNLAVKKIEGVHTAHGPAGLYYKFSFLDQYYGIESNFGLSSQQMSVFETSGESMSQSDLSQFQSTYSLTKQAAVTVDGGAISTCTFNKCGEGSLDIQYIMGLAQKSVGLYWLVGGYDPFVNWVTDIADESNPPMTNSMSWGSVEQDIPSSELDSFNTEAMKCTALGVTILVSSGDNGATNYGCTSCAGTPTPDNCACSASSSSGKSDWPYSSTWSGKGYFPSWPATSPYVTAVGATQGLDSLVPAVGAGEQVCQVCV
jgi:subtilase family serine protease